LASKGKQKTKKPSPTCWRWMLFKSHTRKGIGRPGRYGPKNAVRISLFRGEERRGLQANHQRITNMLAWRRTG
jgi:hypothetical protein